MFTYLYPLALKARVECYQGRLSKKNQTYSGKLIKKLLKATLVILRRVFVKK